MTTMTTVLNENGYTLSTATGCEMTYYCLENAMTVAMKLAVLGSDFDLINADTGELIMSKNGTDVYVARGFAFIS